MAFAHVGIGIPVRCLRVIIWFIYICAARKSSYRPNYCNSFSDKKLSCRREAVRRSISLEMLLSHSRSLKIIPNRNCDNMLSHFYRIPESNGRTDGQNCYINIARQCATRDQNQNSVSSRR